MSVDIANDVWNEIQRQLATGAFASHDDAPTRALAALRFRNEELVAIGQGIDDMEAGRVTPIREFDRAFREQSSG
jgi:Arc/MetJ-type ribon-helix-helix transcriptional regulator